MRSTRRSLDRIVLAYSGDLATSVAVSWLAETYHAEIVTVTLDLGDGHGLDVIRDRALALGAARAHVVDAREEFARDVMLPALQTTAARQHDAVPAMWSWPVLARHLVEIARIEDASAIAHGATGEDRVRLERAIRELDSDIRLLAPASEWGWSSDELASHARQLGLPLLRSTRSIRSAADTPDTPANVELEFEQGTPVKINGVPMTFLELIQSLETIAGTHGVGRLAPLQAAFRELPSGAGCVRLTFHKGACTSAPSVH
jgi:argininosuccinate synthase